MDPILLLAQLLLFALGLNAIVAAQPPIFDDHLLRVGVALVATLLAARVPLRVLLRLALPLLLGALLLALLTLIFGEDVRPGHDYAHRWLKIAGFNLQSSDFLKLALVLYVAQFFGRKGEDTLILGLVFLAGIATALVAMEPDLATAVFLIGLTTALMLIIGVPLRRLTAIAVAISLVAAAFYGPYTANFKHARARIDEYQGFITTLDRALHPEGKKLKQQELAIRALLRGGLFGQGPGGRMPRVPYAYNDMAFAALGFALGFVGIVMLFFAYVLIFLRALWAAASLEGASSILAAGIALLIILQAIVHIGVVLGLFPGTGIPLPLVSYGGSAMLVFGLAMGILHRAVREAEQNEAHGEAT